MHVDYAPKDRQARKTIAMGWARYLCDYLAELRVGLAAQPAYVAPAAAQSLVPVQKGKQNVCSPIYLLSQLPSVKSVQEELCYSPCAREKREGRIVEMAQSFRAA